MPCPKPLVPEISIVVDGLNNFGSEASVAA